MSIINMLDEMKQEVDKAYLALENKGATIPQKKNLINITESIKSIPAGGGSELPAIDLILPETIEYDFDNFKSGVFLSPNNEILNDYSIGKIHILTGLTSNEMNWPINSAGQARLELRSKDDGQSDLYLALSIPQPSDLGYEILFEASKKGYQPIVKYIPVDFVPPTKLLYKAQIFHTNGMPAQNILSLEDVKFIDLDTGVEVPSSDMRKEAEWVDTFSAMLDMDKNYQLQVTYRNKVYTTDFYLGGYAPGQEFWSSPYILPPILRFESMAVTNCYWGGPVSVDTATYTIIEYNSDNEIIAENSYLYTGSRLNIVLQDDTTYYTVQVKAPFFYDAELSFSDSMTTDIHLNPTFDVYTHGYDWIEVIDVNTNQKIALTEKDIVLCRDMETQEDVEYTISNNRLVCLPKGRLELAVKPEGYQEWRGMIDFSLEFSSSVIGVMPEEYGGGEF